jgi:DNA (cytosine-5)-methyltransferase 1
MSQRKNRIAVVDFFCGSGGVSAGFMSAKKSGRVQVLAGFDNDPHSCATYRRNIGAPAFEEDIRLLAAEPANLANRFGELGLRERDRLVLIGCAPCQGFAAHRKSETGRDARRPLLVEFCRLAATLSPDAILMENVPDLLSKQHWAYYRRGVKYLQDAGYVVRARVYNFAGFGLPQERFRTVIMAFKKPFAMPVPHVEAESFRTVRDAIGALPSLENGKTDNDEMHVTSRHRPSTVEILKRIPADGGSRPMGVGPRCLDEARIKHGGYTDVYGRLAWDRPANTITARCRTPSCGRFAHPSENRGLSVREAALLQGFPPEYVFEGMWDEKFKQIGNAVPPVVATALADHVIDVLDGDVHSQHSGWNDSDDVVRSVGHGFAIQINGIKRRRKMAALP